MADKPLTIEELTSLMGSERLESIREIMGTDDQLILRWAQQPSGWFAGRSPYEACKEGKYNSVDALVAHAREGGFL